MLVLPGAGLLSPLPRTVAERPLPEIPDLEGYRAYFNARLPGVRVSHALVTIPIVVRSAREEFAAALTGEAFAEARRQGKYLLFPFESGRLMVVHAMLTGRFQYCDPAQKRRAHTAFVLALDNGLEMRYFDQRLMGKVYLAGDEGDLVPLGRPRGRIGVVDVVVEPAHVSALAVHHEDLERGRPACFGRRNTDSLGSLLLVTSDGAVHNSVPERSDCALFWKEERSFLTVRSSL